MSTSSAPSGPRFGGIQQIGIGIPNVELASRWYRTAFGMDVQVFREAAEAPYMTPYTGGRVEARDAILAVNLAGGGGFEIWQYTSRDPVLPSEPLTLTNPGIFAARIKAAGIHQAYQRLQALGATVLGGVTEDPEGRGRFAVRDPWGNHFVVVEGAEWFAKPALHTGGVEGALVVVSDLATSLEFYAAVLGYDFKVYDVEGTFADLAQLPGGDGPVRRVLLQRSIAEAGPFASLFGPGRIELVAAPDPVGPHAFAGRQWGDRGFIHLCFDVVGMDGLKEHCDRSGSPFTVDSGSRFDMGEAAGRFAYIEDPDGTLIEFVETHRVPVVKKLNWYLDVTRRPAGRSLPRWMVKAMGAGRARVESALPEITPE